MPKIIEVVVSPKGETRVQTKGFWGKACLAASAELEKALGVKQAEQHTAEFFEQAAAQERRSCRSS